MSEPEPVNADGRVAGHGDVARPGPGPFQLTAPGLPQHPGARCLDSERMENP